MNVLTQTLKRIVDEFGIDALRNGKKTAALFADLAPQHKQEQTMLRYLIQCNGNIMLLDALNKSSGEQQVAKAKLIQKMMADCLVSPQAATAICDSFWTAIGGKTIPTTNTPHGPKQPPKPPVAPKRPDQGGSGPIITNGANNGQGNLQTGGKWQSLPKSARSGIVAAAVLLIVLVISAFSGRSSGSNYQPEAPNDSNNVPHVQETLSATSSLLDVPLLKSTYKSRDIDEYYDKLGNSYPNALYYGYGYSDDVDIYVLSKEYSSFTGTIFVPEDRYSHDDEISGLRIIIYGDDKRIYTSPQMQATSYPVDFCIDVRGVDQLKIYYEGGASTWDRPIGLANLVLTRSTNPADKNYVSNVPTRLLDLPALRNDFQSYTNQVLMDVHGNTYNDCIEFLYGESDDQVIYALQGNYSKLTGTVFVPSYRYQEDVGEVWDEMYYVTIFGDGVLLYTSPKMLYNTAAATFEIDVSGVQQLTIMYYGGASTWHREICLADLFLYE